MHPALYRILMALCAASATCMFLAILIKVADKESTKELCGNVTSTTTSSSLLLSNQSTPYFEYPCWDWKFDENSPTCMFNLIFAASVCLEIIILIFFTREFVKCLLPEFAIIAQRHLFCRCLERYLTVALNLSSTALAMSFLLFVVIHRSSHHSCYQFANLTNSCITDENGSCLLFVLLLLGLLLAILATAFSIKDASLWHFIRRDDEERERIYQHYVEYNSIEDVNNY